MDTHLRNKPCGCVLVCIPHLGGWRRLYLCAGCAGPQREGR